MNTFTCDTPTLAAPAALRERMDRIELRSKLLRELDAYLEAIRPFQRPIKKPRGWNWTPLIV